MRDQNEGRINYIILATYMHKSKESKKILEQDNRNRSRNAQSERRLDIRNRTDILDRRIRNPRHYETIRAEKTYRFQRRLRERLETESSVTEREERERGSSFAVELQTRTQYVSFEYL